MTDVNELRAQLRRRLAEPRLLSVPGVYDMISARIADAAGFDALYMTGYGTVASHLGLPDAGLASYAEMVGRVEVIAGGVSAPLIADGDTGFGGLLNLERTIRGYERAGAAAIQLEDQEFPKKCGHTPGRRVIPLEDAVRKIRVAVDSRDSADFLIVARTDARTAHGLDEALRRADAFARAGADILFVESPESEAEMERICRAFDLPLLANMVEGGRTPVLPASRLQEMGYRVALFPSLGFLSAGRALADAYAMLKAEGSSAGYVDRVYDFDRFSRLMGFEAVWDFEQRWNEADAPRQAAGGRLQP